jgi:serine/threonine protein kinase
MFDMLTGQRPFTGASSVEVMTKQIATQPPSLRQLVPGAHIPEAAEELVLKAMSKRPENRQQSMDDLIGELDAVLGALKPAPPPLSTAASKKAELKKTRAGRPSGLTGEFSNFVRESQRKMQTEKPTDPEWDALTGRIASETDDAGSDAGAGGPGKHKGK